MSTTLKSVLICLILIVSIIPVFSQKWIDGSVINNPNASLLISNCITDKNNNKYITFRAAGDITINGIGYTSSASLDSWIVKYNSSGSFQWIINIGSGGPDESIWLNFDNSNNLILCGNTPANTFNTTFKLNNSTIYTLTSDINTSTNTVFLAKFASNDGSFLNAKRITSAGRSQASSMILDNDTVYITGTSGTTGTTVNTYFDGISHSIIGLNHFILKLDPNWNIIKDQFVSVGTPVSDRVISSCMVSDGLVFAGQLYNKFTFNLNGALNTEITSPTNQIDYFIYKVDKNLIGKWYIRSNSGSSGELVQQIAVDKFGNSYSTGYSDNTTFNTQSISSLGVKSNIPLKGKSTTGRDIILLKYSPKGQLLFSKVIGTTKSEEARSVVYNNGFVFISGMFADSLRIGKDSIKTSTPTNQDAFLAVLDTLGNEVGVSQLVGSGTENDFKIISADNSYNNFVFGRSTSNSSISIDIYESIKTLSFLKNSSSVNNPFIANACPIIGLFEAPTTNYYLDPSNPNSGSLAITVKGDVPGGYSYSWMDGTTPSTITSSSRSGLKEGGYTLTTKYLNNKCSKSRAFSFKNSIKEGTVTPGSSTTCNPANGTIKALATDNTAGAYGVLYASIDSINWITATPPVSSYTYTFDFKNLSAGNYQLYYQYRDNSLHQTLKGSKVSIANSASSISGVSVTAKTPTCSGSNNGTLLISATGSSLEYSVNGDVTGSYFSNGTFNNINGQTWDIWIKDASLCRYHVGTYNWITPSALSFTVKTCYSTDQNKGGILISATGGVSPYRFDLYRTSNATVVTSNNTGVFTALASSDTYSVTITDAYGCPVSTDPIIISNTTPSLIDFTTLTIGSLCGVIPGRIIVSATGGTGLYTYQLNSGTAQSDNRFENLAIDINPYSVTLIDAAGCSLTKGGNTVSSISPMPMSYFRANR